MHDFKYSDLIAKIKRKRRWVLALSIVAFSLIIMFTVPTLIEVMDKPVVVGAGVHPVITVLLTLLCFFIGAFAYAVVSIPLFSSMDQECDPEKQLILNMHLNKEKNIDYIYAADYLCLGMYIESMNYAKKMVATGKEPSVLSGLFYKARCEFLMGDFAAFGQTASDYAATLSNCKKLKSKELAAYQKIADVLRLMFAISNNDVNTINQLRNTVEAWGQSVAIDGYINFVKGLAAAKIGDKDEAIYRFKSVKERCSKTVFARLSDEQLTSLNK